MKKMFFAMTIATGLMAASVAQAQTSSKTVSTKQKQATEKTEAGKTADKAPDTRHPKSNGSRKQAVKNAAAPAKSKTAVKTEGKAEKAK